MRLRHKYTKKLIPKHQEFVNKYVCTRYDSRGLYGGFFFCEDEDIAIVRKIEDYNNPEAWGCVNMAHQLLVPFEYRRIWDYGRFLIARNSEGTYVYNKKGQMLYEIDSVRKTSHKAYIKLFDAEEPGFRLAIRKMAISKSLYQDFYVLDNGLAFLQNTDNKVGLVLFSKLKAPFEYEAIAVPQNGYTLAVKESSETSEESSLYDCLLLKVRSQIKKEDSIHPTGITLFGEKTWDEVLDYFEDAETFEKECNSIICYNEKVNIEASKLEFFPFDSGLPNLQEEPEDEYSDEPNYYEEERTYNHYNGSYAQDVEGWSDQDIDIVFDGDPDAYWNID